MLSCFSGRMLDCLSCDLGSIPSEGAMKVTFKIDWKDQKSDMHPEDRIDNVRATIADAFGVAEDEVSIIHFDDS